MSVQEGDFVGEEVNVAEETKHIHLKTLGIDQDYIRYILDYSHPIIKQIEESHSLVRFWLPDIMGTTDHNLDRFNVVIEKQDDGKWKITKTYFG